MFDLTINHPFLVLFTLYLLFNVCYLTVYAWAGALKRRPKRLPEPVATFRKIAVLMPAYREDAVIVDSVMANLRQAYPADRFDIVVLADSLQPATVATLRSLPIKVVEVDFDVSSIVKSVNAGIAALADTPYDIAVMADADNHMASDFLSRINAAFEQGWRVVQGHRTAKNTNTPVAILDAVSEEINNHIFRKGHRALGLSSALIGSGMAFEYSLLEDLMAQSNALGGFDKELEMRILMNKIKVEYLEDVYIYDEKVQTGHVFENQRTRWIAAQLRYLRLELRSGITELFRGNIDYADKVFQTMLLPRLLLLGVLVWCTIVSVLVSQSLWFWIFSVQLVTLLVTLYISIPASLRLLVSWRELMQLPILFVRYIRSIARYRRARNRFLHTPHGTVPLTAGNGSFVSKSSPVN
ncbi:glycosyl transferase family 2 [Fibrisoma limi BUZ 3]|uniref:Glycosyl transferase family 2 n=1 Tax=Fibrisoma limi BUZ 3 TaxID=1185876 RepID=I2GQ01_9BACT|nr:glycosyltransferase family 2 protein [Fibrisoma limi]CCH55979.1 glycosyl transferase family 2 [Fibrisoma limi BUZ 3]